MKHNSVAEKDPSSEHKNVKGRERAQKWLANSHHLWHYIFKHPKVAKLKTKHKVALESSLIMLKHIVIKSVFMLQVKIIPNIKPNVFNRAYTRCEFSPGC